MRYCSSMLFHLLTWVVVSFSQWHYWVFILFSGWGPKGGGGADLHLGGGGARGRHRNDFFPITFIVHNQKSNGGGQMGRGDIVTPLFLSWKMPGHQISTAWPARSTGISPIEHPWDTLDRINPPQTLHKLFLALQNEWQNIPQRTI